MAADPFDNVGCAQGAAFEKFAVQPEDWYAPIYVDAGRRATLRHAGSSRDFLTVQEAVIAWQSLPAEQRQRSTIKVTEDDGPLFKADEIERLHYGPKPPHA
ncbi:MAG: hypothetical protein JO213_03040 [Alphaproteobacteria bacterium]|nr:hypothetical protein [Alphaproteobacteria bacterium]